jgi:hypothetical protein
MEDTTAMPPIDGDAANQELRDVPDQINPTESNRRPDPSDELVHRDIQVGYRILNLLDHGFNNGFHKVDQGAETFSRFLAKRNEAIYLEEKKKGLENSLREAVQRLAQRKGFVTSRLEGKTLHGIEKEFTKGEISKLETEIQKKNDYVRVLVTKREAINPEYGWMAALMFLIAGVVFITSDIAITYNITANAYMMKDFEAWSFALGLGLTSFLMKPLIDRYFEREYQENGRRMIRKITIFYIVLGLTSAIMLLTIGTYRGEVQSILSEINKINSQMSNPRGLSSESLNELKSSRVGLMSQMADNPLGIAGFILSGLLFAVGGAVSLSIAFPSLSALMNRYWILPFRLSRLERILNISAKSLSELTHRNISASHMMTEIEELRSDPEIEKLESEVAVIREEIARQSDALQRAIGELETGLYLDGYQRGEKYPFILKRSSEGRESRDTVRPYRRRPFIEVRKMITNRGSNMNGFQKADSQVN